MVERLPLFYVYLTAQPASACILRLDIAVMETGLHLWQQKEGSRLDAPAV
jgi:hypothetical protein